MVGEFNITVVFILGPFFSGVAARAELECPWASHAEVFSHTKIIVDSKFQYTGPFFLVGHTITKWELQNFQQNVNRK